MKDKHYRKIRNSLKQYEVTPSHYSHLFGVFYDSQEPTIILARTHNEAINRYQKRYNRGNYSRNNERRECKECWATWKVKEVGKAKVFTKYF